MHMHWREEHRFLNHISFLCQWHGSDFQRPFALWGSKAVKEKVCALLLWAAVPRLCTCHHVLGKYFDVILAFWRSAPPELLFIWKPKFCRVLMQSWAWKKGLIQMKLLSWKQWGKISGLCLVCIQRIGNVTKYLCCHLHSVQYPKNI